MFASHFVAFATMAAFAFVNVRAETHTITFVNKYVGPDFGRRHADPDALIL